MASIVQVGAGSGGMPVLDMLARNEYITRVTLIEPDLYKPHNVERHLFPPTAVGRLKAELARDWLRERRPNLVVELLVCDVLDPGQESVIEGAVAGSDLGICAVDNEEAKYHWDRLMRRHGKSWTLGEVLSGGIGGFVHGFRPGGPCYGCVASYLKRSVRVDEAKAPDYSQPGAAHEEATVPASKASIEVIAALHAHLSLQMLDAAFDPGFTTMLLPMQPVPGIFAEPYKPFRFRIPRAANCLLCGQEPAAPTNLDAALEQALGRLGHA